ncbi:MAG: putative orfan [Terrestrivirus sp.]|uniref:Putative orfan n=1 Tax=Terrestrivirus sp. TaxID=2487775 RepID=A0A3G4ZK55_9VIRU|nr:MAG: putative orfan [Terrestrivirus sp.]
MTEYFVFCEYDSHYPSRAIFIPLKDMDSDIKKEFDNIIELGDKIKECFKTEGRSSSSIGYEINGKFDDSEQTRNTVGYWSSLTFQLDHDHEGNYPDNYLVDYINDANRYLSPNELHNKLSKTTVFCDQQMIVKKCVMVSDTPFETIKRASLRFFMVSGNTYTAAEVKQKVLKDKRFYRVMCAAKDDGSFVGYGFVELNNNEDFDVLSKAVIDFEDIKIVFQ